ncbi:SDR family oxidoreductase [Candidatus Mycolicibacterium alkanivorans]|uniref:SDR family oxidoreductase n=1 Tax=Candidatus Mycolicibacterium alkanivorans TaxID=2954114 RepID=UPI00207C0B15
MGLVGAVAEGRKGNPDDDAGASGIGWGTAQELAGEGWRVTIADRNTDLASPRAAELGAPHSSAAAEVTGYVENTALGRPGTPEEIAEAGVWLCSPQSSWMTGEILDLNGGAHLKRYPNINQHLTRLMNQ